MSPKPRETNATEREQVEERLRPNPALVPKLRPELKCVRTHIHTNMFGRHSEARLGPDDASMPTFHFPPQSVYVA